MLIVALAISGMAIFVEMPVVLAPSVEPKNNTNEERPINMIWENGIKVYNASEASKVAGFTVHFPSKIPTGYNLQMAVVDQRIKDNQYVFLFYSPNLISNTTTLDDFFGQNGIYIYYHESSLGLQNVNLFHTILSNHIKSLQHHGFDAHEIEINYYHGWMYEKGYSELGNSKVHYPSQLDFFMGGIEITMESSLHPYTLMDIAKSISS